MDGLIALIEYQHNRLRRRAYVCHIRRSPRRAKRKTQLENKSKWLVWLRKKVRGKHVRRTAHIEMLPLLPTLLPLLLLLLLPATISGANESEGCRAGEMKPISGSTAARRCRRRVQERSRTARIGQLVRPKPAPSPSLQPTTGVGDLEIGANWRR